MAALRSFLVVSWLLVIPAMGRPSSLSDQLQKWAESYTVTGVLRLPYAEIEEPFQAWYDGPNQRSRIDYYGGMDVTIQRGDLPPYGANYRICPETTETEMNVRKCFQTNGTQDAHVNAQRVLPDLTNFKFIENQTYGGEDCSVWQYVMKEGYKVNTYTMYITSSSRSPVHYEMLGFDSLLGSHYDKYEVDYVSYDTDEPKESVFDIPEGMVCTGFPGPGAQARLIANPMQEFIEPDGKQRVDEAFEEFLHKHPKHYANHVDRTEHDHRRDVFRQNLRFINSKNRQNLSYRLAVNHLADRTDEEIRFLRGRQKSTGYNGGQPFDVDLSKVKDIPDSMNWRLFGAVTPVKDQGVCGSCWSFGTTGTIEGALFLKTKQLVRLSQQNLIDCTWGFGNNGCDGGEEFRAYQWIMKHGGITTEQSYGQYLAQDGYCHFKGATVGAKISSYVNVTSGDQTALKVAIAQKGPISVGIDASHKSFSFYSFGVYYEPECGNKLEDLDHAVLAVGYGTMNGQEYWLVKNSWSTHWGNDGYVLMSLKDNNCGVATDATFVVIE